jgi:hypothetical protein
LSWNAWAAGLNLFKLILGEEGAFSSSVIGYLVGTVIIKLPPSDTLLMHFWVWNYIVKSSLGRRGILILVPPSPP